MTALKKTPRGIRKVDKGQSNNGKMTVQKEQVKKEPVKRPLRRPLSKTEENKTDSNTDSNNVSNNRSSRLGETKRLDKTNPNRSTISQTNDYWVLGDFISYVNKYDERGWRMVKVRYKSKAPKEKGWQNKRLGLREILRGFRERSNLGILLGEPSGWLVDVDLDCREARELARYFLPYTPLTFGRKSAPISHMLYTAPGAKSVMFRDPIAEKTEGTKSSIVEIRSSGSQTIFPPSVHPENEVIEWCDSLTGKPTSIDSRNLHQQTSQLASAVLLARYWPPEGSRQDAAMALAGGLLRNGWSRKGTLSFITAIVYLAETEKEEKRKRCEAVEYTADKLDKEKNVTGFPSLAKLIDEEVFRTVAEWLDIEASDTKTKSGYEYKKAKVSQIDNIIKMLDAECIELFRTADNEYCAHVRENDRHECWQIRSEEFKAWINKTISRETRKMVGPRVIENVIYQLEGKAISSEDEREIFLRVAEQDGVIYIDLANSRRQVVRIDSKGWKVVDNYPVHFRRPKGMKSLPAPQKGGSIEALTRFLNINNRADLRLYIAFILHALRPGYPQPILCLGGEQGTGKTIITEITKSIIDPNYVPSRSAPNNERDLSISAHNTWLLAFDNLSRSTMKTWLCDAFCRISTGGGLTTRKMYSDKEETLFRIDPRPLLLNGIDDLLIRPDIADRGIVITLKPIPKHRRRGGDLLVDFRRSLPSILGAIYSAISCGLRRLPEIKNRNIDRPRLADFAEFVTAAEPALGWPDGSFLRTFEQNRSEYIECSLANDIVADCVIKLLKRSNPNVDTPTKLYTTLSRIAKASHYEASFPRNPQALSSHLKRIKPQLRETNIDVKVGGTRKSGNNKERIIEIRYFKKPPTV